MKSSKSSRNPMNAYVPANYWAGLAEKYCNDGAGFAPVLHPDAPSWFNRLIDGMQFRAMRRALALANIPAGGRILDVGCGTGRWVRRYQYMGLHPTGVDAQYGMLRAARALATDTSLIMSDVCRLPLPDGAFDAVSDVTVVQHLPTLLQQQAIGEMLRVLKPGGRLILMELIRGQDQHIFPRSPDGWIGLASSCGAKLIDWFGQEFFVLDRVFVKLVQSVSPAGISPLSDITVAGPRPMSGKRGVYWSLRYVTAQLAAWSDPVAEKVCPAHLATHGVFVLRK